jgi:hypothetical protein
MSLLLKDFNITSSPLPLQGGADHGPRARDFGA